MDTYQVEIIKPGAKKLLHDMAEMDLITVQQIGVGGGNGNTDQTTLPADRREAVMALAGSWGSMSENDFQQYLHEAKKAAGEMFDRDIKL